MVFNMLNQDAGKVTYQVHPFPHSLLGILIIIVLGVEQDIGGLNDQIRELREVIELPLTNPELFVRVGIKPPKVRGLCSFQTLRNIRNVVLASFAFNIKLLATVSNL